MARVAGIIAEDIRLPVDLVGRQRVVFLSYERLKHLAMRRPDWLLFCLTHMSKVLADPQYVGYRPAKDPRRIEFVRGVVGARLLLVAVKVQEPELETWVSTAHPMDAAYLTRRLRAGTMHKVSRGP